MKRLLYILPLLLIGCSNMPESNELANLNAQKTENGVTYLYSSKWECVEGIIAVYDRLHKTFRVSALDDGVYIFKAENHGWLVQTRIKK